MYLDCASRVILDKNLYVVKDGVLSLNQSKDCLKSLPGSFKELVTWQFYRIQSKTFQKIVKCASCIGRFFSIEELCAVWPDTYPPLTRNQNVIALKQRIYGHLLVNDYFEFFEQCLDSEDEAINPNHTSSNIFKFRFSSIKQVVHDDIMSHTERSIRHKNLIAFYDRQLNTITEPIYIPLISYHYSITYFTDYTSLLKRIRYLVMLGIYLSKSTESYMEARFIFSEINRVLNKYNMHEQLGTNLSSQWHVYMALAHSHGPEKCVDIKKSIEHVKAGMKLLELPWPEKEADWNYLLLVHGFIVIVRSWRWALGSSSKKTPLQNSQGALSKSAAGISMADSDILPRILHRTHDRLVKLEPFLPIMSELLYKTHAKMRDQIACDVFSLSIALRLNRNIKDTRSRLLIAIALKFWFMGHIKTSIYLFQRAYKDISDAHSLFPEITCPVALSLSTLYLVACGRWDAAEKQASDCMIFSKKQGMWFKFNFEI